MEPTVDVVIAGGGPAGCATAIALRQRGHRVAVLERRSRCSEDHHGEILPPAAQMLLVRLGVWEAFLRDDHSPAWSISSAWGSADVTTQEFFFHAHGNGWHLDRLRFDAMLTQTAMAAGATVQWGAEIRTITQTPDNRWRVVLDDGTYLGCRFVVDATGRVGWVGRSLGARRIHDDYLVASSIVQRQVRDHATYQNHVFVEAVEHGWWYSAIRPNGQLVQMYMTDADLYARARRQQSDPWHEERDRAPETRLLGGTSLSETRCILAPAGTSRLEPVVGLGWLAVGDAAAAFDPLAAQGLYRALDSGLRAAQSISEWLCGDAAALPRYSRYYAEDWARYLGQRSRYYRLVQRWPESIFWRRRQSSLSPQANSPVRPVGIGQKRRVLE